MEVTNKVYTLELLKLKRGGDVMPPRTKKYFRSTKSGAGMTAAGVAKYRRDNPGSKLKTAVTGKVNLDQRPQRDVNHFVLEVLDK